MVNFIAIYGRKFTLTLLVLILSTVLLSFNQIDANIYATLVLGTVGAYITSNVLESALDSREVVKWEYL